MALARHRSTHLINYFGVRNKAKLSIFLPCLDPDIFFVHFLMTCIILTQKKQEAIQIL
jgi:hypothetical protein